MHMQAHANAIGSWRNWSVVKITAQMVQFYVHGSPSIIARQRNASSSSLMNTRPIQSNDSFPSAPPLILYYTPSRIPFAPLIPSCRNFRV